MKIKNTIFAVVMLLASLVSMDAVTIYTVTNSVPLVTNVTYNTRPDNELGDPYLSPFASFNFNTVSGYSGLGSLAHIGLTMSFRGLETGVGQTDYNNIQLTVNGYNTGLLLNGFGSLVTTQHLYLNGVQNASDILNSLNATGIANIGFFDSTLSPDNAFRFGGSTAYLTVSDTAIPFSPASTAGLTLVGAWLIARYRKQAKQLLGLQQIS
jgi:hypothetical protein